MDAATGGDGRIRDDGSWTGGRRLRNGRICDGRGLCCDGRTASSATGGGARTERMAAARWVREIRADGGQAELDLQPGEDGSGTGRRASGRGKRPRRTDGRVDGSLRPRMGTARTALTDDGCCYC